MRTFTLILAMSLSLFVNAQIGWVSTFESVDFQTKDTFWNGADTSGGVLIAGAFFRNNYNTSWKSWDGFSVSNSTDSTTKGFVNQYSVFGTGGTNHTDHFAVLGTSGTVILSAPQTVRGCYLNNATYAALSMRDGDAFAKKFGGTTGNDPDYFKVIATGYSGSATQTDSFFLADYRFSDNKQDYIINEWTYFDLSGLGVVDSIVFNLESTDTGQFGMNTPAYFCMDNFNAPKPADSIIASDFEIASLKVDTFLDGSQHNGGFEFNDNLFTNLYNTSWKSWTGWSVSTMTDTVNGTFANQYSSIAGSGVDQSKTYLTGYNRASILLSDIPDHYLIAGTIGTNFTCAVSNTTYGYKTMLNGDAFAKKFGGPSGDDQDYLVLKISGVDYYGEPLDTIEHYLADYRFDDNSKDYISKDWEIVAIDQLIYNTSASRLDFWIEGSDTGQFGLNTPAYFCIDEFYDFNSKLNVPVYERPTISLYPNPTSDRIFVDVSAQITGIEVLNLNGSKIKEQIGNQRFMDLSEVPQGMYLIKVNTEKGSVVTRCIKK